MIAGPLPRLAARRSAAARLRGVLRASFAAGAPPCCASGPAAHIWASDAAGGQPAPTQNDAASAGLCHVGWLCAGAIAAGAATLATAPAQQDPVRLRPGARRRSSGVAALAVSGACLSAGASAEPRTCAAWQCDAVPGSAVAFARGRRVSFDLTIVECTVDSAARDPSADHVGDGTRPPAVEKLCVSGVACLDPQLDGQWLCPASAADGAQATNGEDGARRSVEMLPGGGPPATYLSCSLRPRLGLSHSADADVLSGSPTARDGPRDLAGARGAEGGGDASSLMQSSAGAAASHLALRDIYNLLLDREIARSLNQFDEADRLRKHLLWLGVTIDDQERRWQARDGRRGRRPNAEDSRWEAGAPEPAARADRIAAGLAIAAAEGDWTSDRFVWNQLRDRELARCAFNFDEADRIRAYLQELGFNVDDKRGTWSSVDGRTGPRPSHCWYI